MKLTATLLFALGFSMTASAVNLVATYEVPVGSAKALMGSNQFRIQQLSLDRTPDGQTDIKYLLPLELTGNPNVIAFTGKIGSDGKTEVSYDDKKMKCDEDSISLTCAVSYKNLDMNLPLAQKMMAKNFPRQDLQKRLQVLEKFSTDPVGIIRIYKRPVLSVKK